VANSGTSGSNKSSTSCCKPARLASLALLGEVGEGLLGLEVVARGDDDDFKEAIAGISWTGTVECNG
jgi:hypothetical protein